MEPYRDYKDDPKIERLAEIYGVDASDLEALAATLIKDGDRLCGIDETGLYEVTTYNPDSKWDWYTVEGRWSGYFALKDGSRVDEALKGDVDWEKMRSEDEHSGRHHTVAIVGEGVYQAVGVVGWFGAVDTSHESEWRERWWKVVDGLSDDAPLTLVDMHI
jgi:hypothetical protein